MCGICGFIDFKRQSNSEMLSGMVESLRHRGPDSQGKFFEEVGQAQIGFGHTRLSILDLSNSGSQPFHYEKYSVIYNGEVYNFVEIRNDLLKLGHRFISESDTEVILHAFAEWGKCAVNRFIGMFAIAILDRNAQKVYLFRDRPGVKPLYYHYQDGVFIFGSELKAINKHLHFSKEIDEFALKLYFQFGYIPAPHCIFKNTFKLEPGKVLCLDLNNRQLNQTTYWDVANIYRQEKTKMSYEEAKIKLENLLVSSSDYRMVADVPVGVFLSGGYDSSLVTAVLQKERSRPLKTFTIGFEEGNNEAPHAREVANFLGTDHTEYICSTAEAQEIIPKLPYYYDEPFSDSSAIPTMLVSAVARQSVTVALSADGGDELFAGYDRYQSLQSKLQKIQKIPSFLRVPVSYASYAASFFIDKQNWRNGHLLDGFSNALKETNNNRLTASLFRMMHSSPKAYINKLLKFRDDGLPISFDIDTSEFDNWQDVALAIDYKMYLQDDILTKVDRATMSVSLEGREPLLDHRLLEFAAKLPSEFKFSPTLGRKRIFKDIIHTYVPKKIMDRPKAGFSIPIFSWLNNDLQYLLKEFLSEDRLKQSGFFNVPFALEQVRLFLQNKLYYKVFIWRLLMFQMWYDKWYK